MEARVQKKLIEYLKDKGCYVIKLKPGFGIPTGAPDVLALYKDWWGVFECKASSDAPFQPLQEDTLELLGDMGIALVVYPENYDEVVERLEDMFI